MGGGIVKCSNAESLARNGAMAIWMALERRDSMLAGAAVLMGAVGYVGIMGLGELIAMIGCAGVFFGKGVGDGSVALVVLGVTGALMVMHHTPVSSRTGLVMSLWSTVLHIIVLVHSMWRKPKYICHSGVAPCMINSEAQSP